MPEFTVYPSIRKQARNLPLGRSHKKARLITYYEVDSQLVVSGLSGNNNNASYQHYTDRKMLVKVWKVTQAVQSTLAEVWTEHFHYPHSERPARRHVSHRRAGKMLGSTLYTSYRGLEHHMSVQAE